MNSIFTLESFDEINTRLKKLNKNSNKQWGTMDASQMLAHCCEPLKIALGLEKSIQEPYLKKLIMGLFKHKLYDDSTWKKNLPTTDQFKIFENKNFDLELESLKSLAKRIHQEKNKTEWDAHPIFGKFTTEQWGKMQYKHLDHHLKQFGV
ncbi:MAG: hypothetical protein COA70_14110 [Planctomycetota bacterium]|nr:MAG: hypothetical protein COA70_14110 [Planctomycetota bacterium]